MIGDLIVVRDLEGETSVTNDAEAVVECLAGLGRDLDSLRLIYCDQMVCWDDIIVKDGRFARVRLYGRADPVIMNV